MVPWNYPRCPEVKLAIPNPTSGHQEVTPPRCPECTACGPQQHFVRILHGVWATATFRISRSGPWGGEIRKFRKLPETVVVSINRTIISDGFWVWEGPGPIWAVFGSPRSRPGRGGPRGWRQRADPDIRLEWSTVQPLDTSKWKLLNRSLDTENVTLTISKATSGQQDLVRNSTSRSETMQHLDTSKWKF